ncbi:hypothetical protein [Actinomadura harenae]|nr:hypothetical protein [Actinomadura harenae]
MDRRSFVALVGTAITSPAHEWLIAHPITRLAQATGTAIPAGVVDHLDGITDHLRRMDDQVGGGPMLRLVHEQLRYVTTLLRNGRYDDSLGRRLHAVAAELLRLAGFAAFDSGRHGLAQWYWDAGLRAAHAAGDSALGANILGFKSCQAKDAGGGREAVVLANSARLGYSGASGQVTAILALRAAEAAANDRTTTSGHRASQTRHAIDDAFNALDDPPPATGHPAWAYWMDPAQAHAQAGYCYLRIGEHAKARTELRAALRLQDKEYSREGALRHVLLATTYLQQTQPDLEHTLAHAHQAADALTGHVDSARCRGHLDRLAKDLQPYRRTTKVQELLDRSRAMSNP